MKKKEIQVKASNVTQAAPALIVGCSADYGLMFIRYDPHFVLTPSSPRTPPRTLWEKSASMSSKLVDLKHHTRSPRSEVVASTFHNSLQYLKLVKWKYRKLL